MPIVAGEGATYPWSAESTGQGFLRGGRCLGWGAEQRLLLGRGGDGRLAAADRSGRAWRMMLVGALLLVAGAAAAAPCNYTLDAAENARHQIRGGKYFSAVGASTDPTATASSDGCAARCCATAGCRAFSLNTPWVFGPFLGCVQGEACCALAAAANAFELNPKISTMNISTGVLTLPPDNGKPPRVPESFDCGMRHLALEYAQSLRSDMGAFESVHDALQLGRCPSAPRNNPQPATRRAEDAAEEAIPRATMEYFVATDGDDAGSGTLAAPFATPARAVSACRAALGTTCTVTLRGGTYFLADSPLQLTAADSGLTIRSHAGERAELSGGAPLTGLQWARTHITTSNGSSYAVWAAPFRASSGLEALRMRSTGRRVTRARYPNADPETMGARRAGQWEGWVTEPGVSWFAAPSDSPGEDFASDGSDWPDVDWSHHKQMANGRFTIGRGGGRCGDLASGVAYCECRNGRLGPLTVAATLTRPFLRTGCGQHIPRGDTYLHRGPGGLRNPAALPLLPAKDPKGVVVHMWAGGASTIGPWFTLQWRVAGFGVNGSIVFEDGGGTQGSEGWTVDGAGGPWAIENALELLGKRVSSLMPAARLSSRRSRRSVGRRL